MQYCVHAEGLSPTRCLCTTLCAARRSGQGGFIAVSQFSPFVLNFFLVPHARKKLGISLKKKVLSPGKNSVEDARQLGLSGREGRAGMAGLVWMGLRPGLAPPRGGGVRVPTSLHRIGYNASSELNNEGKVWYFHWIFPWRYRIFPYFYRIFPEEKIRRIRGKIRCYHLLSSPNKLGEEGCCVNNRQDSLKRFKPVLPCTRGARKCLVPARRPGTREGLAGLRYAVTRERCLMARQAEATHAIRIAAQYFYTA